MAKTGKHIQTGPWHADFQNKLKMPTVCHSHSITVQIKDNTVFHIIKIKFEDPNKRYQPGPWHTDPKIGSQ